MDAVGLLCVRDRGVRTTFESVEPNLESGL